MKYLAIVGARPQFIKASPLSLALRKQHHEVLLHTGQHYDYQMSDVFLEELGIPAPDYHLNVGSKPHGAQTGAMLSAIEEILQKEQPHAVIVYGDTNSTLAGALASAKLKIPIAHVEAGLRSFNRAMPEEVNRILTDHVSTWLFAPSKSACDHLSREGILSGVHIVGDIMYDSLLLFRGFAEERSKVHKDMGLKPKHYYVSTIHRAENTDNEERLSSIFKGLGMLEKPVILPLHPRTLKKLEEFRIRPGNNVRCLAPLGYLDMLMLQSQAACVLTDSGGVQKEAYYFRVPCVTLRTETEWMETVAVGWNTVVGTDPTRILEAVSKAVHFDAPHPNLYGDGHTAERIVDTLSQGLPNC